MVKRILLGAGALLFVLAAVVFARALMTPSRQLNPAPVEPLTFDESAAVQRLSDAITFRTVTVSDGPLPTEALISFRAFLEARFPRVHERLRRELIAEHSLLYTWPGKDSSLPAAVLMAHQDVVPVEPGTEAEWTHPPFSGAVADGAIWGRGSLDDKNCLLSILEAAELSLARGVEPERTLLFAFGHDEEVGGEGAEAIAQTLKARGIQIGFVLDEGLAITHGLVPGFEAPVALIGLAEKGYLTLRLSVRGEGGHSSMPPEQTAVGVLAKAVSTLEAHPFPAEIRGPARNFLEYLGPEADFGYRLAFTNLWLFEPVLASVFAGAPSTAALIRTTTAATMFQGSPKDNVLPQRATAAVNFRILPGDSVASVEDRVARIIDDERVHLENDSFGSEPSPVSDLGSRGFRDLQTTIEEVYPEAVVAPSLVLGATDSRFFTELSNQIFRFSPFAYRSEVGEQIHGTDEHIPVSDYVQGIHFYLRLLEHLAAGD